MKLNRSLFLVCPGIAVAALVLILLQPTSASSKANCTTGTFNNCPVCAGADSSV